MSVLNDLDVKSSLEHQHHQLGIITCNKTSDNFVFFFRKYYLTEPRSEVSLNGGTPNKM